MTDGIPTGEMDKVRISLAEEELRSTVHERQKGMVRFTKRVENEPVEAVVDVQADEIVIERIPRDEVVQESRQPWYEDEMLVIPIYEERLVTEKRLVLTEEIHVRRQVRTEQVQVRETVRREVVDVETIATPSE
jgi:uncharacterized protein (TIGR02271 family)